MELRGDFNHACESDDLAHTINYYEVCQRIQKHCQTHSYKLIEKLANELLKEIANEFSPSSLSVEVKKFIIPEARYISFKLVRDSVP